MFTPPPLLKKLILYPVILLLCALIIPPFYIDRAPQAVITPSTEPSLKTHRIRLSPRLHQHMQDLDPLAKSLIEQVQPQESESLLHSCPDAYLLPSGTVITKEHKILQFGQEDKETLNPHQKKLLRYWWLPKHQKVNQTIAVLDCYEGELYENWLFEVLPKIGVLRASGQAYDYLLIPQMKHPYQSDSLSLLDVDKTALIESSSSTHLQCSQALIPVLPRSIRINQQVSSTTSKNLRPSTIAFLRECFPPRKIRCPTPKKLFICAKNEPQFYLTNEEELTTKLLEIGFVKVYQEDLNFSEQIHLFSQAQEIISLKRSILANLVFSQPGTQVMELIPKADATMDHRYISSYLGIEHQVLYCQKDPSSAQRWFSPSPHKAKVALIAPIDEIITLLHNL